MFLSPLTPMLSEWSLLAFSDIQSTLASHLNTRGLIPWRIILTSLFKVLSRFSLMIFQQTALTASLKRSSSFSLVALNTTHQSSCRRFSVFHSTNLYSLSSSPVFPDVLLPAPSFLYRVPAKTHLSCSFFFVFFPLCTLSLLWLIEYMYKFR